jgi:hypothetical protein
MATISSSNEEIQMLVGNGLAMPFPFARKVSIFHIPWFESTAHSTSISMMLKHREGQTFSAPTS